MYSVSDVDMIVQTVLRQSLPRSSGPLTGPLTGPPDGLSMEDSESPGFLTLLSATTTPLSEAQRGTRGEYANAGSTLFPALYRLPGTDTDGILGSPGGYAYASATPHYEVYTLSLPPATYKEHFTLDHTRSNVYESLLVFLLMIFLTTDEELVAQETDYLLTSNMNMHMRMSGGSGGSGGGSGGDYVVVKELLLEVISKEDLTILYNKLHRVC